jgi:hypothetical protein
MGLQGGESMMERQRKSEVLHLCGRRRFSFEVCSRSHLLDGASSQPRSKEPQFVDNHFRRPPFLSTTVFVNHRFRRPPFSSTIIFVNNRFHRQPFSPTTVFVYNRFCLHHFCRHHSRRHPFYRISAGMNFTFAMRTFPTYVPMYVCMYIVDGARFFFILRGSVRPISVCLATGKLNAY